MSKFSTFGPWFWIINGPFRSDVYGFLDVISTLLDLGGDAFAFDDRGRLPLFSHCNTNGGLSALYDLFEHMMKKENSRKIRDLLSEEDIDHDSR